MIITGNVYVVIKKTEDQVQADKIAVETVKLQDKFTVKKSVRFADSKNEDDEQRATLSPDERMLYDCDKRDLYFDEDGMCLFRVIKQLPTGVTFGDIAIQGSCLTRTASIFAAAESSMLLSLDIEAYQRIFKDDILALRTKLHFFENLFPEINSVELNKFVVHFHRIVVKRGTYIYKQGEPSDKVFLIKEGEVEIIKEEVKEGMHS